MCSKLKSVEWIISIWLSVTEREQRVRGECECEWRPLGSVVVVVWWTGRGGGEREQGRERMGTDTEPASQPVSQPTNQTYKHPDIQTLKKKGKY